MVREKCTGRMRGHLGNVCVRACACVCVLVCVGVCVCVCMCGTHLYCISTCNTFKCTRVKLLLFV